jgi:hypothetical protein
VAAAFADAQDEASAVQAAAQRDFQVPRSFRLRSPLIQKTPAEQRTLPAAFGCCLATTAIPG